MKKISPEATNARIRLHATAMSKLIAGNSGNWPVLLERYAYKCKALHDEPQAQFKILLKQECGIDVSPHWGAYVPEAGTALGRAHDIRAKHLPKKVAVLRTNLA